MRAQISPYWPSKLGHGLLLAGALLTAHLGQAQTADTYAFAPSTSTFAPLPASAINVASIQDDDALSGSIPLGFAFTFDGTVYTACKVSSNGWLTFNANSSGSNRTNDLTAGDADNRPLVAPFWDDLDGSSGTASYQTTGTAPNRVFTFEWKNWEQFFSSSGTSFSMQVQLVEGTNVVRFAYTQQGGTTITDADASIGLSGVGTGSCSFLSLGSASAAPTTSSVVETDDIATFPAAGQAYSFTPTTPSACPTPRCLAATAVTATTATVTYSVSNTTPGPFTILYGPAGFNPAQTSSTTNVYSTITATGTTATLTGLTALTGYQFYVVQNCGGTSGSSSRSNSGSFNTDPSSATNDECTTAIVVPVGATCTTPLLGTVNGATQSLAPTASCGFGVTTANDVWYSFVATSNSHTIALAPQFDAAFDVRTGSCTTTTTSVFCGTIFATNTSTNTIGGLTVGQTYFLRIYATDTQPTGSASVFTLCITPGPATPANDDCAGALNVPIQFVTCTGQTSANNTAATASTGAPTPGCASYNGGDLWFKVTVPASGTLTVQTVSPTGGSNITDTGMEVYSGTCAALSSLDCDDDGSPSGTLSLIDLNGRTPGEVLYVRVWAYGGNATGLIAVCATTPSNCAAPTSPSTSAVTDLAATLHWVAPAGSTTGNTYEVEYGPQNFVQGAGTLLTGLTGTSRAITGLTPNTAYCFYVRQNCGATNGSSTWVGPTCFTTPLTVPTNDEPCGAIALGVGSRAGTNLGATTSVQAGIALPVCSPSRAPQDVWYAFTPTGTSATFTLTGTAAGMVRVYASPSCSAGPFTLVSCASSGANNTAFTAPVVASGLTAGQRYYLAVSGYGSSDTAGSFTITGTGLVTAARAQAETDALLVYPNPSSTGQITLKLSGLAGSSHATLLNALGQTVLVKTLSAAAEQTLSTRGLAAGVYTLRVDANNQTLTRKVVLE